MSSTAAFYVCYSIVGFRGYAAGPYASWDEAHEHERDIAGYEGVHNVFVTGEPTDEYQLLENRSAK
jgi:hypothetical protein